MIGKSLGKFKEEYGGQINKGIFVSPKLYYLNTLEGEITKAKGISLELTKFDFNELLKGASLKLEDEIWERSLDEESVRISNKKMVVSGDYDKRNKLFSKGRWVDTSPLIINESFEIITTDITVFTPKNLISYSLSLHSVLDIVVYY